VISARLIDVIKALRADSNICTRSGSISPAIWRGDGGRGKGLSWEEEMKTEKRESV